MNATALSCPYHMCYLDEFRIFYGRVRVAIGLLVCTFGTITNTLNIIVLCQKRLRKRPINVMLTVLSIAQLFLLTGFLLLMLLHYLQEMCVHATWTLDGAVAKLIVIYLNNVWHTTAFACTLYIASLRVIAVRCPYRALNIMTPKSAWIASLCITIAAFVLCIPVSQSSVPAEADYHPNCSEYWSSYAISNQHYYDLAYSPNTLMVKVSFLLCSVILKLIPCVIIIILISLLISSLKTIERRSYLLKNRFKGNNINKRLQGATRKRENVYGRSRTTKMLITVVLVCVSIELPHGLLHLISAIEGDSFAENVYDNLGDVIEMLTLLYSSINFVIYCSMSSDFLDSFRALFCGCDPDPLSRPLLDMSYLYANNNWRDEKSSNLDLPINFNPAGTLTNRKKSVCSLQTRSQSKLLYEMTYNYNHSFSGTTKSNITLRRTAVLNEPVFSTIVPSRRVSSTNWKYNTSNVNSIGMDVAEPGPGKTCVRVHVRPVSSNGTTLSESRDCHASPISCDGQTGSKSCDCHASTIFSDGYA